MSKEFIHRGGLWVLGQSVLLLAVAALGVVCRGESSDGLFLLGGGLLLATGALTGVMGGPRLKSVVLDVEVRRSQAREGLVRARNANTLATRALRDLLGIEDGIGA